MPDVTTQKRLIDYLALYSRAYPGMWAMAEKLRTNQDKIGIKISPWCYLPVSAWMAIVENRHGDMTPATSPDLITDGTALAALAGWRYTQGIYQFNSAVYAALLATPPAGDLPCDVLLRLPEWCVYVETPGGIPGAFDGICGMFIHLDHGDDADAPYFRAVLDFGDRLGQPINMSVGPWSVDEGIERTRAAIVAEHPHVAADLDDEFISQATATANAAVSLALYLCADEPEIDGYIAGSKPHYPTPTRTKRGWQLFPPDKPRLWHVGEQTGAAIEHFSGTSCAHEHKGPRPHIRRAHWHGFWSGPIKPREGIELPPRRFGYKWIPPIAVGVGGDDD